MSKTEIFFKEIIEHLEKSNIPNVNEVKILSDLEKIGAKISFDPKYGSYLSSAEILRRYGNQIIPEDVLAVLKIADIWSLENAKTKNFRYLRLVAQGWELFEDTPYLPLIHALFSKFRGVSAFGNLQIWEHFGGLMTIGTDKEDNRYFVSSIDDQSSVFWMNHESESPGLNRWVCQNFSSFIKFQLGCNLPELDRLWMGKQGLGKIISK